MGQGFNDLKLSMGVQFEDLHHKLDLLIEGYSGTVVKTDNHERRIGAIEDELPIFRAGISRR